MISSCKSNIGHRLLYGLGEYINSDGQLPEDFLQNLVRGSPLEEKFIKLKGDEKACIRDILTFLRKGGKFDVTRVIKNGDEIDCSRFCLKVLKVFVEGKVEGQALIEQEDFWRTYAKVAVRAFAQSQKKPVSTITLRSLLLPLMDKFINTSNWELRYNIVKCLQAIAFDVPKRNSFFWNSCKCCLGYYEAVALCHLGKNDMPIAIRRGIKQVFDLWATIAIKYSQSSDVQRRTVEVALRLLNLIDMVELEVKYGLMRFNDALLALKFETIDYITGGELSRPRQIQSNLEDVGFKLIPFLKKTHNKSAKETLNTLLPYLWGSNNPRDRRVPPDEYSKGTLKITGLGSFEADIKDICGLSYRAFHIYVNGLILRKNYLPWKYYKGNRINGIPSQKIDLRTERLKNYLSVNEMALEIPYKNQQENVSLLEMPCAIQRAVRTDNNSSRFVVWTPKDYKRNIQKDWKLYVNSLQKTG